MRSLVLLIFVFFNLNNNYLLAQEKLNDSRFKKNKEELRTFLMQNLQYPGDSQDNKSLGYSITGITITPKGEINDISIINSIDNSIDEEVKRVLKKAKIKWLKSDSITTNQTFYVQIVFLISMLGTPAEVNNPVKDGYNFLEPVIVTAATWKKELLPETDDSIGMKINEFWKNGNYEATKKYIDELIRRNPFNNDLYQFRISINKKINRNDLIMKDVGKMQNFIPGVPLDELIN